MGALLRQRTKRGVRLLLVGPKGLARLKAFPGAAFLRAVTPAEARQVWGLSIPRTTSAALLRHL